LTRRGHPADPSEIRRALEASAAEPTDPKYFLSIVGPRLSAASLEGKQRRTTLNQIRKGHVEADGVRYGYEIYGDGAPLLLLHGGFATMDMFAPMRGRLAERRQVIAVDLYGHGRTALTDRPIDAIAMGDDMAALVRALGFERVDALGYSAGGKVAFRLAVQHPEVVGKLVLASVPYADTGFHADIRAQQNGITREGAAMLMRTPLYDAYKAVAPRVEDFPEFVARMGEAIRKPFDWSEDVKTLKPTTLLVYGDSDMFEPEHIMRFYQLLGGGLRDGGWDGAGMVRHRLAILPGVTHYTLPDDPGLLDVALAFLEGA
jgi:pimeloyl-ACP methyl ester carboxylesterase